MNTHISKFINTCGLLMLGFSLGFVAKTIQQSSNTNAVSFAQTVDVSPTPSISTQPNNSFGGGNQPTPTPSGLATVGHPFDYVPLPADHGPESDIVEVEPLTASRPGVQVDDSVTFHVALKNQASYRKKLYNICFESSDGNMGCQFNIDLNPGQQYSLNNVGTWTSGGQKKVWVTWSQDFINYYIPQHANTVTVSVLN